MRKTKKATEWTPSHMLLVWALRQGEGFRDPCKTSTGGEAEARDDELRAMRYVESVQGFDRVRDVLRHVYVEGFPACSFHWRGPGETVMHALLRRRWGSLIGVAPKEVPQLVHDEFVRSLEQALIAKPFNPITDWICEETAAAIANTAGEKKAA